MVVAMIAGSLWAWLSLPDGARIPTHWNADGQVDGYANKTWALSVGPVIALSVSVLFAVLPSIAVRRDHFAQSSKLYAAAWISTLAVICAAHTHVILTALGSKAPTLGLVPLTVGITFVILGNYMGKVRSNFFMGIRTPWTLSSELSWKKTHRMAGPLFMLLGLAVMVSAFISMRVTMNVIIVGTIALVLIVGVYSYSVWRKDPDRG
jgi:uncharacterized membrane protein